MVKPLLCTESNACSEITEILQKLTISQPLLWTELHVIVVRIFLRFISRY